MAAYCPRCNKHLPKQWVKDIRNDERFRCSCGAEITTVISTWWTPPAAGGWAVVLSLYLPRMGLEGDTRALMVGVLTAAFAWLMDRITYQPKLAKPRPNLGSDGDPERLSGRAEATNRQE